MALHHARPPGSRAGVAARFPDMLTARDSIEALENAGVDGDHIELLGRRAEAARTPTSPSSADRRVAGHLLRRLGLGALVGAVGGAIVGVVLGLVVLAVTATERGAGLVAALVLTGIGLGVVVSVFLSFARSVGFSSAWPLTFEDAPEGSVWVAVYSGESHVQELAHDTFTPRHPLEVRNCE